MLGAKKIGVLAAAAPRAAIWSGERPVVPMTMGLPAAAAAAAEATELAGAVKSMTTAPGHLASTVGRSSPTTHSSPASPSVQPLRSSAPARRYCSGSALASRIKVAPMRPKAPMTTTSHTLMFALPVS